MESYKTRQGGGGFSWNVYSFMEADHQKKAFQGSLWNSGWLSGGPKSQTQFNSFQNLFFQPLYGWVIGWCHQHGESPQNAFLLWLASLVPSKQGAYLLPMCSTTQVQKWTKGWVSCSLWAAMIQTGCRVSRCSLRTLEMWHFQLQLHFSKKYIKCVKQATSNSESCGKYYLLASYCSNMICVHLF